MIPFIKKHLYTCEDPLPKEFMTIRGSLENTGQKNQEIAIIL